MLKKSKKGFTLLEIVVAVAIIGLVASIILVSINSARARGRDAKRYAETDVLKKAMELHYNDNDQYPEITNWIKIEEDADVNGPFSTAMQPYLSQIPRDPLYPEARGPKVFSYQYQSTEGAQGYKLHVEMETGAYVETSYEVYAGEGIILDYTAPPAPTVDTVAPNNGSIIGGTEVTITGTEFVDGATITFGGTAATNVAWVNDTTITADAPAHALGAVDIVVTNPDTQNGTLADGYTYIAIGIDAISTGSTTGTSITISHTTSGSNRLMLVGVSLDNDNDEIVTGITYNGVTLVSVGTAANNDDARIEIWRLIAPNIGTHNVVITFNANLLRAAVAGVMTFTGVNQGTPLGTFASDNETSSNTASVNVPSAAGELVFGVVAAEDVDELIVGAGQAEHWNMNINERPIAAGSTKLGAITVTMSWELEHSDHWAIGGVSIREE